MSDTDLERMQAAVEFSRRRRKGLPSDRWADGDEGMKAVADGIDLMYLAMSNMIAEREQWSEASMEATADPMRHENA